DFSQSSKSKCIKMIPFPFTIDAIEGVKIEFIKLKGSIDEIKKNLIFFPNESINIDRLLPALDYFKLIELETKTKNVIKKIKILLNETIYFLQLYCYNNNYSKNNNQNSYITKYMKFGSIKLTYY
ncbi:hypothetical protein MHK_007256, partial [Candidatus Magnetomorum sp. HK-1]